MPFSAEEKGKGRASPSWLDQRADVWELLSEEKTVVSATIGSLTSTWLGYPLDSLKSRMQTARGSPTVVQLTGQIFREEGARGFWRGCLIPLVSIAVVRTTSFTIYSNCKTSLARRGTFGQSMGGLGVASFVSGCLTGSILSVGSTPFELLKVRRQLDLVIAKEMGIVNAQPMNARQCVTAIVESKGWQGLYTGFQTHLIRDSIGTGLYFAIYDTLRTVLGRQPDGVQGPTPTWSPIPASLTPLFSGSLAGVSAFALIYPADAIKTNVQKRALANQPYRSMADTFKVLVAGPDPLRPQPLSKGFARLYKGLGVSAVRSCFTHGLLWLVVDNVQVFIEKHRLASSGHL